MEDKKDELNLALEEQEQVIEGLKKCTIFSFKGFGKNALLVFDSLLQYPDGHQGVQATQRKINDGYYKSIEDFDSYHSADIEFMDLYSGDRIDDYREKSKINIVGLAKEWRKRISDEFPCSEVIIVVHKHEDDWYLDTFNYRLNIDSGIYL